MAIATSGNYRNFHKLDGKKYGHTINPKTGYPEKTKLLSATILSESAIQSDGFATVCMVKGLEDSMHWVESIDNVEGYFIYINENATLSAIFTSGFSKHIVQ